MHSVDGHILQCLKPYPLKPEESRYAQILPPPVTKVSLDLLVNINLSYQL
jgi:hypothetical protein